MLKIYFYFGCWLCLVQLSVLIPKPDDPVLIRISDKAQSNKDYYNYQHEKQELTPDDGKLRLQKIAEKIDENNDGLIDLSEMKNWIKYNQRRYIDEDITRAWNLNNPENISTISWISYLNRNYGLSVETDPSDLEIGDSLKRMVARDRRRWKRADSNSDDLLTHSEFAAFLHPELHPSMRDVILSETIEDIDSNNDGKISMDEYINDMYQLSDNDEPEWVKSERESFMKYRDANGDMYLDRDEVGAWILPENFDNAESEAKHLISEADINNDGQLNRNEILEEYDLFVGSQVTDFGEALTRHDEL